MKIVSRVIAALAAAVVVATAGLGSAHAASSAAILKVDPPVVAVAKGEVFALQVLQDASVETSGAQASIDFDPTLLQVVSVQRGAGYSSSPVFAPEDITGVIAKANTTGHLAQIAAAFTPPNRVAAGTTSFLIVRFRVVGCGQTDVNLPTSGPFNAQMISGQSSVYGSEIPVTTSGGHVTTCVGADLVTGQDIASAQVSAGDGGVPVALVGVPLAAAIAAAMGVLLLRSRRRADLTDEYVD